MSVSFLKWLKIFFENLKKFWRCEKKNEKNDWSCRKKDPMHIEVCNLELIQLLEDQQPHPVWPNKKVFLLPKYWRTLKIL